MAGRTKAKTKPKHVSKGAAKHAPKLAKKASKTAVKIAHKAAPHAKVKSPAKGKIAAKSPAKPAKPVKAGAKSSTNDQSRVQSGKLSRFGKLPQAVNKIKPMVAQKPPTRPISGAVKALEAGIKLMYAEQYDKAIKCFNALIADFPDEVEIQAAARANIHACEKKMHDKARAVIRSADDHYHVAVAFLNGGQVDPAMSHLQQALKLEPKGGHILYAIAAANALKGNKEQALSFLKQSIHHGPENRFHAAQDSDFAALVEEPGFRELLTTSGK
jgi:tetratricopeptide (TPR) repeat protein